MGALDQGEGGPERRSERSRSRDPSDRNTSHANQRGSASASSGANVRPPSLRRHPAEMQPVSCSEDGPSPITPNSVFELRDQQPLPPDCDASSSSSSEYSSSDGDVEPGQFAEDWEVPRERD